MEITYLGHSSFKIKTKNTTLVTDPYDSNIVGLKYPILATDVVTISHNHPDHNCLERLRNYKKVITEPGEYEIANISIIGLSSYHDSKKGEERGENTLFIYEAEGLRIAHLGDLGCKLTDKILESIGEINILMINSGHPKALSAKEAVEIVRSIEPEIILPMHYKIKGQGGSLTNLETIDDFLKEAAVAVEKSAKINIKLSDIIPEEQKIILLDIKQR